MALLGSTHYLLQKKRVVWHVTIKTLKDYGTWEFFIFNIRPCKGEKTPSGAT